MIFINLIRNRRNLSPKERAINRFWRDTKKTDTCWLWLNKKNHGGYGVIFAEGKNQLVHRYAWRLMRGPIERPLTLDHLCRNKLCVNPDHLEPLSSRDNTLRGYNPAANNRRKTHCIRGHLLSGVNLVCEKNRGNPRRKCRICSNHSCKMYKRRIRSNHTI